jgi:truncated hemoglobin YjbI
MSNAVQARGLSVELEKELMDYLHMTARILINTGESEQIKWGNPNAN